MASDDSGSKTEKPTPKRLRDARKDGQFPKTMDAPVWAGLAGGVIMLPTTASATAERARQVLAALPDVANDPSQAQILRVVAQIPTAVVMGALPSAAVATVAAFLALAIQGVYPSNKALKPKFNRMSPKNGLKRMFGPSALWEAAKALLKVVVITTVVFLAGQQIVPDLMASGPVPLQVVLDRGNDAFLIVAWSAIAAGVGLAFADYSYQRRRVTKQLRMSLRDIKDELKNTEGDPMLKSAIRSKQIAMSRNRMLQEVSSADAVLVNPTHLAVAVKYEIGKGAPKVVAKGADALALKIRERAREARVPVIEDKPLARALYRICEVGDEVPSELYMAIAQVLAFVMRMGKPSRTAGPRRPPTSTKLPELPTRARLRRRRARDLRAARAARRKIGDA